MIFFFFAQIGREKLGKQRLIACEDIIISKRIFEEKKWETKWINEKCEFVFP